jgi:hypothetical protein
VGGPGNSLERNYHYSIENDLNFICREDIKHLFERYDNLWMNGRVRSMNLQLYWALLRLNMSDIDVINTSSIAREYTTHGLHLNS